MATNEPVELTISAAASLQDALEELKTTYEQQHNTINILYNFGGSGALQQQILQGAPADLFFSAAEDKFDALVEKEMIDQKQGTDLLANELVLIVPKTMKSKFNPLKIYNKQEKLHSVHPKRFRLGSMAWTH